MKNLKEELKTRYLRMEEYFKISTGIFSDFIKNNKKIIFIYFLLYFIINITSIVLLEAMQKLFPKFEIKDMEKVSLTIFYYFITIGFINLIVSMVNRRVQNDIVVEIEGKNSYISTPKLFLKQLKYIFLFWVPIIFIIFIIFIMVFWISQDLSFFFLSLVSIFSMFHLPYFDYIYFIRGNKLIESLRYGFHLNKGNRFKLYGPLLIVALLIFLKKQLFDLLSKMFVVMPFMIIPLIVESIISTFFVIYVVILGTIIFLNVEYIDLKKIEEISKKNEEF